ncbi:MAG TPA: pyridoxal 5'-phosphate synthase glutaminase subunit PdxT, partial [Solirubrobacterales bacterium]|nr:pyridoxal 5'-phosphate synthase glutaminase subunit PdxT [Solirubrobacterales bacterium]
MLAVQGGFEAHGAALGRLGAEWVEVRLPADLEGLGGLILPGGESTTITMGIEAACLGPAIKAFHREAKPILATCAGMIIADRDHLGLLDIATRRNAFGRQLASFEADLAIAELGAEPFRAVFIRAPWAESLGDGVELLAEWEGHPVGVREGSLTAYSF